MDLIQILAISGMISPIMYTIMWVLLGSIQPNYSHIRDDISSLLAIDAPYRRIALFFMVISSVSLFLFFLGLPVGLSTWTDSIIGSLLLIVSSFLGVLVTFFFPLDEGGEILTFRGKMHVGLVVGMGILTLGGMAALWFELQLVPEWSLFATYSLFSAIISLFLVILSGVAAKSKYLGLVERIMVTPYQLYYFVLSLMVFLLN